VSPAAEYPEVIDVFVKLSDEVASLAGTVTDEVFEVIVLEAGLVDVA
jgi:hypothetical protein